MNPTGSFPLLFPTDRTPSSWEVSPSVQEAVDKYITEDPSRFRMAQRLGEFIVDHPIFSRVDVMRPDSKDIAGEEHRFRELNKLMAYHGLKPNDMDSSEIDILKGKLGSQWKEKLQADYGFTLDDFRS